MSQKKILIIAGFEPTGDRGILRDLQVFSSPRYQVACVLTALTSQPEQGEFKKNSLENYFSDQLQALLPLSQFDGIKIGMLANDQIIFQLQEILSAEQKLPPIILDPVIQSSTGKELLNDLGKEILLTKLGKYLTLITPNLEEFYQLSHQSEKFNFENNQHYLEKFFHQYQIPTLVTGIKNDHQVIDQLITSSMKKNFSHDLLFYNGNSQLPIRGTGCYLSSLITKYFIETLELRTSVDQAIKEMTDWLKDQLNSNNS